MIRKAEAGPTERFRSAPAGTKVKPVEALSNFSRLAGLVDDLLEPVARARRAQAAASILDVKS